MLCRYGYDKDGYDQEGYDRDGYNREGKGETVVMHMGMPLCAVHEYFFLIQS